MDGFMLSVERLRKSRWLLPSLLVGYCGFLFFYGLNNGELYRNETLRAIIAREMLETGNWVVPTLYGQPLFTKPPGMYVAIALCSYFQGEVTEWSARLPSALAATAIVWLMYWFFSRQLDRTAGFLAALLVPMSVFWLERSTSAEIDMLQVAWVTASLVFFFRAISDADGLDGNELSSTSRHSPLATRHFFLALICVAGGTLTKWTAPAFFYSTVIPFLWWRGRLKLLWSRQHLLSALIAAALVLAWIGAALALTSWELFYQAVSREALNHLVSSNSHHGFSVLETILFPAKVLATMLPWSFVGLIALRPSFSKLWDERGRLLLQALHCWTWPNLLLWSLASEHAVRYSAPLFPALSGLAAMVWLAWWRGLLAWKISMIRPAKVLAATLAAWLVVKVVFVHAVLAQRTHQRQTRDKAAALAAMVPLGKILYLFKVKDEGIMFYFARTVLRLADPGELPVSQGGLFCILTEEEWRQWPGSPTAEVEGQMRDAQGDRLVLVRVQ
jgi:4-amino-4-deoxy-L-arabinose transferase-like glycosyltransferase